MDFSRLPKRMRGADGRRRFAFVTFLMLNDSYLPGCLVAAQALREQRIDADLVCLVTEQISQAAISALKLVYDRVVSVESIYMQHVDVQRRQATPFMFTRLNALRLGEDGDLGCRYEKVVVLDADVLPLRNYGHLFALMTPAGVINENKYHCIEVDADNKYVRPADLKQSGKWCWHRIYEPDCPHGRSIPVKITDRVATDPTNLGINGSLFVLQPSIREYASIRADLRSPTTRKLVGETFTWPDMQYLTLRWSGRWTNVDLRFSALNGYPDVSVLFGTHFAGVKPWYFKRGHVVEHYGRFPDYQLWYRTWQRLARSCPQLLKWKRLERLNGQVDALLHAISTESRPGTRSFRRKHHDAK